MNDEIYLWSMLCRHVLEEGKNPPSHVFQTKHLVWKRDIIGSCMNSYDSLQTVEHSLRVNFQSGNDEEIQRDILEIVKHVDFEKI